MGFNMIYVYWRRLRLAISFVPFIKMKANQIATGSPSGLFRGDVSWTAVGTNLNSET